MPIMTTSELDGETTPISNDTAGDNQPPVPEAVISKFRGIGAAIKTVAVNLQWYFGREEGKNPSPVDPETGQPKHWTTLVSPRTYPDVSTASLAEYESFERAVAEKRLNAARFEMFMMSADERKLKLKRGKACTGGTEKQKSIRCTGNARLADQEIGSVMNRILEQGIETWHGLRKIEHKERVIQYDIDHKLWLDSDGDEDDMPLEPVLESKPKKPGKPKTPVAPNEDLLKRVKVLGSFVAKLNDTDENYQGLEPATCIALQAAFNNFETVAKEVTKKKFVSVAS